MKLSGSGTTMMRLPSKINARLYGYNLTVSLPPGSELSFVKSGKYSITYVTYMYVPIFPGQYIYYKHVHVYISVELGH